MALIFPSWCLNAFADFWSLNGETILMGASCSSDTCCFKHTFSVASVHFNKMSDGFLYEGFGIMQGSKHHFKTFVHIFDGRTVNSNLQ